MEDQRSSSQKPHVRYLQHGCTSAHKQLGLLVSCGNPSIQPGQGITSVPVSHRARASMTKHSLETISMVASFESDVEQLRHQFGLSGGKQEKP